METRGTPGKIAGLILVLVCIFISYNYSWMDRSSGANSGSGGDDKVQETVPANAHELQQNGEEKTVPGISIWGRRDVLLVLLVALVKFGDAVELYLPGVITQVKPPINGFQTR